MNSAAHQQKHATWPTSPANRDRPLAGVKVLDLSRVLAGPFCAMVLADLGADVIKVEAPDGDETRRWGPPFFHGTAAYYFGANRNKWDVVLDLGTDDGRASLRDLLRQCDVVLQNYTAQTAAKFGADYASVSAINSAVIHLTLSAFAPETPERRGYDVAMQALSGMMAITGSADGAPAKVGVPISDLAAALYAVAAITSALYSRAATGRGRQLEVALFDSVVALMANQSMSWLLCGADTPRLGMDHPVLTPYGAYRTADRPMILAVGSDDQFQKLCSVLGRTELAADRRFRTNAARIAHREELRMTLEETLSSESAEHWRAELDRVGVPNGAIRSVPEALESSDCRTVANVDHPDLGTVGQVMTPIRVDGSYLRPYLAPPGLGEHGDVILGTHGADT